MQKVTKSLSAETARDARAWYLVDAEGQTLGRLATRIACALRGKHNPAFTPHVDCGDFVIVVNAAKLRLTGKKADQKIYYRYTGYPGGIREQTAGKLLEADAGELLRKAVTGMLPRNRLGRHLLGKLKVYSGPEHPHAAQKPAPLPI